MSNSQSGNTPSPPPKRRRGRPPKTRSLEAVTAEAKAEAAHAAMLERRGLRKTDLDPMKPENRRVSRDIFRELGNDRISEALQFAAAGNEESQAHALWARMHDPVFADLSPNRLMRESGLTIVDILTMIRNRDIALGLADSGRHIAGILDDMGVESRSRMVPCEHCSAERRDADLLRAQGVDIGSLPECQWCDGKGKLMIPGVQESRKIFLKAQGVLKDGSGAGNVVNVGVQVNPEKPKAEPITIRVQKILDGAIDAEILEK